MYVELDDDELRWRYFVHTQMPVASSIALASLCVARPPARPFVRRSPVLPSIIRLTLIGRPSFLGGGGRRRNRLVHRCLPTASLPHAVSYHPLPPRRRRAPRRGCPCWLNWATRCDGRSRCRGPCRRSPWSRARRAARGTDCSRSRYSASDGPRTRWGSFRRRLKHAQQHHHHRRRRRRHGRCRRHRCLRRSHCHHRYHSCCHCTGTIVASVVTLVIIVVTVIYRHCRHRRRLHQHLIQWRSQRSVTWVRLVLSPNGVRVCHTLKKMFRINHAFRCILSEICHHFVFRIIPAFGCI